MNTKKKEKHTQMPLNRNQNHQFQRVCVCVCASSAVLRSTYESNYVCMLRRVFRLRVLSGAFLHVRPMETLLKDAYNTLP